MFYGESWNWPKMAAQALNSTAAAIERQDWTSFYSPAFTGFLSVRKFSCQQIAELSFN